LQETDHIYFSSFESPIGLVEVRANGKGLLSVFFMDKPSLPKKHKPNAVTALCEQELREYFEGLRKTFTVPLSPEGSGFQQMVWQELLKLPHGKTASYLDISLRLGDPKLTRAVGSANGKNPIAVIVPCHRVIGSDGSLTGYAGGMHRKKWLLRHEGVITQQELF